jgi:hypothetical protein
MLKNIKTIFFTALKLAILAYLLFILLIVGFKYLPKEQQDTIHNFCRNFTPAPFQSISSSMFIGKACDADPQVQSATCKNAVILDGNITKEMYEDLKSAITREQLPTKLICLRSHGGVTQAAEAISDLIRRHQLDTCLSDYVEYDQAYSNITTNFAAITKQTHSDVMCDSACPFILISGKNRMALGDNFKLRLHSGSSPKYLCLTTIYESANMDKGNPLLDVVNKSPAEQQAKHQMLYQRSLLTDFKKLDEVSHDDFDKYAIFNLKP